MEPSLTGLAESEEPQLIMQMDKHMPARSICLEYAGRKRPERKRLTPIQPAVEGE